jgi:hypothetical protein
VTPRDRTTLRRALAAGGIACAAVGLPFLLGVALGGGSGRAGVAAVLLGLTVGCIVGAGWLLLAVLLDLMAGEPPSGARLAWTLAAVLAAASCPALLLAAGG